VPIVGRSSQLAGALLTSDDWGCLAGKGERVYLFYTDGKDASDLPECVRDYVRSGEEEGVSAGYKCSIREPWYKVPGVWAPDCFLYRQIYDFPRIVLNKAKAASTDTIHRVKCKSRPRAFLTNFYTFLSAASAEIEGRSYGGGVLELEPTEAERVLVPAELRAGLPPTEIDSLIRRGRFKEALAQNSKLVLQDGLGLSARDCNALARIWRKMRDRRIRRPRARPR
jgi:hypothetical protein